MKRSLNRTGTTSRLFVSALTSAAALVVLVASAGVLTQSSSIVSESGSPGVVRIYCAAGIAGPIESIVENFNESHSSTAQLIRIGGSGELAGQICSEIKTRVANRANIFISNDEELLKNPTLLDQIHSTFRLAEQKPVIATAANRDLEIRDLSDLTKSNLKFGIASEHAAIGKLARVIAQRKSSLSELENAKTTETENVMILAQALVVGSLDAAIVWDTTVMQFNSHANQSISNASLITPKTGVSNDQLKIACSIGRESSYAVVGVFKHPTWNPISSAASFQEHASNDYPMAKTIESKMIDANGPVLEFAAFLKSKKAKQTLRNAGYQTVDSQTSASSRVEQ